MALLMSSNSAEVGSSIFAAIDILAFFRTGSDVSEDKSDVGASNFAAMVVFALRVAPGSGLIIVRASCFSSTEAVGLGS
jgi:hypothetical protein